MNKPLNTELLDRAIIFAVHSHGGTERRGKGFPYIVHPLEAVEIVATITSDQELLAAAALHDVVEDCGVSIDIIRTEFGEHVASLVASESETPINNKSEQDSWRERKQAAINRLRQTSYEGKIVAIGDKLSNMRAIYRDYCAQGDELWSLFHAPGGKADHEWHYRGLACALCDLVGTFAYNEFAELINKVFGAPKPEQINLDDYEQSGDGYTATTYTCKSGDTMIKLYSDFMPDYIPLKELQNTWNIQRLGIKIPNAYRLISDGKRIGVEFQQIKEKQSYARAISNNPEQLDYYATEFAHQVKKLHNTRCNKDVFPYIKDVFYEVVDKSELLDKSQKEQVRRFITNAPDAETCIHGDLHIGNIITTKEETYWIDLGDFAWGHPLFDIGMFYLQTHFLSDELCQHLYHISKDSALKVWTRFVEVYFKDQAITDVDALCAPYACLYLLLFDTRDTIDDFMRECIYKYLLKN